MIKQEQLKKLYSSLQERWRPEDVLVCLSEMGLWEGGRVRKTYMSQKFSSAVVPYSQIKTASELFPSIPVPRVYTTDELLIYCNRIFKKLQMEEENSSFLRRVQQKENRSKEFKSHRAYNKRVRFALRFKEKIKAFQKNQIVEDFTHIAKSRLAHKITYKDFSKDINTAALVAYLTARLNRRSTFTWGKQEKAYDQIAKSLYDRLDKKANWYPIAMIDPTKENMSKLTKRQLGKLIGTSFETMRTAASILEDLASDPNSKYNLDTLIVRRGNDSSTWNAAAGAFNKARDIWITAMLASGLGDVFEKFMPGKALRLMAADVAYMHLHYGSGDLDDDTKVWKNLPFPWDVISGEKNCNREMIIKACREANVSSMRGWIGWEGPRPVEITKPTPELVHGVVVTSPEIAKILRKNGYFSGKKTTFVAPITKRMENSEMVVDLETFRNKIPKFF